MLFVTHSFAQACFPDKIVTAAFASGGSSVNKEKVLWLTWGSTSMVLNPYGKHNISISVGDKSYASIKLSNEKYLCVEATIISISGGAISSYASGNYSGDSMDDLYNIGGTGGNNKLVSGIRNSSNANSSTIRINCKATINGEPIRLAGLVLADSESLASGEYINAKAQGSWNLVELKKNTSQASYNVRKINNPDGSQTMNFLKGNDRNTAAIAFLSFNENAYNKDILNPDLSVEFEATLKGGGLTAMSIGLLTPNADLGDAPVSYGAPVHLLQDLTFTFDNIFSIDQSVINDANEIIQHFSYSSITSDQYNDAKAFEETKDILNRIPTSFYNSFLSRRVNAYSATNSMQQTANNLVSLYRDLVNDMGVVNVNTVNYSPGELITHQGSFLGSTAPDQDATSMHSKNAVGDDLSGNSTSDENAWPSDVQKFSYKSSYAPGANFSVVIPYKNGKPGAKIVGWIDFDLNGQFDENEMAYVTLNESSQLNGFVTLNWIIPTTRKPYSTFARLRYIDPFNVGTLSPTNNVYYGEVEDHRIYILGPSIINPALLNRAKSE